MTHSPSGVSRNGFSRVAALLVSGVVLTLAGLVGALLALQSALIASYIASQPKGLVGPTISKSGLVMSGLHFDPSTAHYVPPNLIGSWAGLMAVILGIVIIAFAVYLSRARSRST